MTNAPTRTNNEKGTLVAARRGLVQGAMVIGSAALLGSCGARQSSPMRPSIASASAFAAGAAWPERRRRGPARQSPGREHPVDELDLQLALERLNQELGVKRLLVEGGGVTNGIFLRAGLVDEVSLLVCPFVDGAPGAPCLFDAASEEEGQSPSVRGVKLTHHLMLEGGVIWLRYRLAN